MKKHGLVGDSPDGDRKNIQPHEKFYQSPHISLVLLYQPLLPVLKKGTVVVIVMIQ